MDIECVLLVGMVFVGWALCSSHIGTVEGLIIVSQLCRMFEKLGQSFSIDCKTHSIHRDHGLDVLNISLISEIISLFLN